MAEFYTGVGSRVAPADILVHMHQFAYDLARLGYTLRSGGADGADTAFEEGTRMTGATCEIYLPWPGFNGSKSMLTHPTAQAYGHARDVNLKRWGGLPQSHRKLFARNVHQVLGPSLTQHSSFLLCWTPDGCVSAATRTPKTGGTATAILIAEKNDIPVFNFQRRGVLEAVSDMISKNALPKKKRDFFNFATTSP